MGQSKICGRQRLKTFKFFKGCLPQILLGLFLNTLRHISFRQKLKTLIGELRI